MKVVSIFLHKTNKMKYLSTLFILLFAFYIVNGQRCDDLMISEIVFGNEASFSGDTTFGNQLSFLTLLIP
jgi:hypothetical protein